MLDLYQTMPQVGRVEWIGLRPGRRQPMVSVEEANISVDSGLAGDRFAGKPGSKRMVTLIQAEHLGVVAAILGQQAIDPAKLRRNIVVSGINLLAMKAPDQEQMFQIGDAVLQMTGNCHPCSRMEENLGPGGFNAMRGHGGITTKVIDGGQIAIGSEVRLIASGDR